MNIWERVKWLVFLKREGGAEPQSITELLQCGLGEDLENCWGSGIDVGAGCWGWRFVCALILVIHRSVCRQICDGKGFPHASPWG